MIEGIDFPGILRKINFIMSRIYNVFTLNTMETGLYINKTGVPTVKGELVKFDTASEKGVVLTAANDQECIGAFLESGIADGASALIGRSGSVQVMLKDTTGSVPGNWVKTSNVAGRADASLAAPPGGGVVQLDQHMQEIGHTGVTAVAGTAVLCEINMHEN